MTAGKPNIYTVKYRKQIAQFPLTGSDGTGKNARDLPMYNFY